MKVFQLKLQKILS